jgi:hypothetical protein
VVGAQACSALCVCVLCCEWLADTPVVHAACLHTPTCIGWKSGGAALWVPASLTTWRHASLPICRPQNRPP